MYFCEAIKMAKGDRRQVNSPFEEPVQPWLEGKGMLKKIASLASPDRNDGGNKLYPFPEGIWGGLI
jgi:hypothetical protein